MALARRARPAAKENDVEITVNIKAQSPADIRRVGRLLQQLAPLPLPKPGPASLTFSQGELSMLATVTLPVLPANLDAEDIHDRRVIVYVDDVEVSRQMIGVDPATTTFVYPGLQQGQKFKAEIAYADDGDPVNFSAVPVVVEGAANVSGPADTVPPSNPGEASLAFSEEA
jgi:hypothetical protein